MVAASWWGRAWRGRRGRSGRKRGSDRAKLDVAVLDRRVGVVLDQVCRIARVVGAGPTVRAWGILRRRGWEVRIEPEHVDGVVRPERHDEHDSPVEGLAHPL